MKIKELILLTVAGFALASCSKEVNNPDVKPVGNSKQYAYVEFVMNGEGTRALDLPVDTEDNGNKYNDASDDERKIESASFYFFNDQGNQVADPYKTTQDLVDGRTDMGGIVNQGDGLAKAIVVMKNPTEMPSKLMVVLNSTQIYDKSKTLSELKDEIISYESANGNPAAGKFTMSNSVYMEKGDIRVATPVSVTDFHKDPAEARSNPVKIAVERVLARVQLAEGETEFNNLTDEGNLNSEVTNLTLTIKGWWLDNTHNQSYLFKHLSTSYSDLGSLLWNDEARQRSYWADALDGGQYEHHKVSDQKTLTEDWFCLENTNASNTTKLVVLGQLKVEGTAQNLYRFMGTVYTESGMKIIVGNNSAFKKYRVKEGSTYRTLKSEEYALKINDAEDAGNVYSRVFYPEITTSEQLYEYKGDSWAEVDKTTANDNLKSQIKVKAQFWKEGMTYYFTDIKHLAGSNKNAIIRNHLYRIKINTVKGLGTPIPDPESDEEINPEKPEGGEAYLGGQIYVLPYRVVEQSVDLDSEN